MKLGLCAKALLMLGFALPSYADADDITSLHVCNTGSVPVDAVSVIQATRKLKVNGHQYLVLGWLSIPAHECNNLFVAQGDDPFSSYLGFAFQDSAGV